MNISSLYDRLIKYLNDPKFALLILVLVIIGVIIFITVKHDYATNFFSFGPTKDINGNSAQFMGIYLDTWNNVIMVIILILIVTIVETYYNGVLSNNLLDYSNNVAIKNIPYSKFWTYFIKMTNPIVNLFLYIIRFYATSTFQLQYIIPQFIGSYFINIPFVFETLHYKKFNI